MTSSPSFWCQSFLRALCVTGLVGTVSLGLAADAPPKVEKSVNKAVFITKAPKPIAGGTALTAGQMAQRIDGHVGALLSQDNIAPSPKCPDAEFCRRVYLDLAGKIPTAQEALGFIEDKNPNKREKLVETILASKDYARHQADLWQSLMVPITSENRRLDPEPLVKWLEKGFEENKPWDQMTREILTATGPQDENGATTYFLANNPVDRLTDSVCKLFLGVQLQCAQCHNHPFNPQWKQADYWHTAAFFMKVKAQPPRNKEMKTPMVTENNQPPNKKALPESAKKLPPKFPAGATPTLNAKDPYRPVFAKWITNDNNPFFAKATVNRVWAQMFGRGLVHPVDDIQEGNPASHAELFEDLASQFKANHYNLHHLIKSICLSEAYQRTSMPHQGHEKVSAHYLARMPVKVLSPEQMFDSLSELFSAQGTGPDLAKADKKGDKKGDKKATKIPGRPGSAQRNQFLAFFRGDDGADLTDYQAGIPQVLRLMNSPQLNNPAILRNLDPRATPHANIDTLFLAILGRKPTHLESSKMKDIILQSEKPQEKRQAYADICWVLLNTSEFALNH